MEKRTKLVDGKVIETSWFSFENLKCPSCNKKINNKLEITLKKRFKDV
jgi:hypothetical protein